MNLLEDEMNSFEKGPPFLKKRSTILLLILWVIIGLADLFLNYAILRHFKAATNVFVFYFFFVFAIIPGACLLASLLLGLLPFKGLAYSKKYPSITVLLMIITQLFLLGMSLHTFFK